MYFITLMHPQFIQHNSCNDAGPIQVELSVVCQSRHMARKARINTSYIKSIIFFDTLICFNLMPEFPFLNVTGVFNYEWSFYCFPKRVKPFLLIANTLCHIKKSNVISSHFCQLRHACLSLSLFSIYICH